MYGKNMTVAAVAALLVACAPTEKGRKPASVSSSENATETTPGSIPDLRSIYEAGNQAAHAGDWERARARWHEVLAGKPDVTWIMEEAEWGVAFSDALNSTLPRSTKKKIRDLFDSYSKDAGHKEIDSQVADLLQDVQDEKLRLEIKKVANHAWERDRRLGRFTSDELTPGSAPSPTSEKSAAAVDNPAANSDAGTAPPVTETSMPAGAIPSQTTAATPPPESAPVPSTFAPGALPPMGPDIESIHASTDDLIAQGKYLPALQSLENADARADQDWIQQKKLQIGDRFCEEKRNAAVDAFKNFKKASADATKRAHLKRTAVELDSCLAYFPDIPVSPKVRRNRDMVEAELKKLGE